MFFNLHPDAIKLINEQRKKNIPTFEDYFNKRYLEECKYFVENPKFSFKYMLFVSHLKENVKKMALKEYNKKYPGVLTETNNSMKTNNLTHPNITMNIKSAKNKIEDEYDIIEPTVRRSKRLQNK